MGAARNRSLKVRSGHWTAQWFVVSGLQGRPLHSAAFCPNCRQDSDWSKPRTSHIPSHEPVGGLGQTVDDLHNGR
ncbi:hypothetical protein J6590_042865 [Homalodisca vitripennis]|nr:hypothetical protein J6590_042865 [Homalodisca vitripennis]